jgi:glutathione S-transferase
MGKVQASLDAMEKGLGDKLFCSGIHLSLADIAVGCALGYLDFRFPDLDWRTTHTELHRLYDKLMARASFTETLPA